MAEEKSQAKPSIAWETRVLCSDESCIGVIGPDGRCKECGLEYQGPLPVASEEIPPAETSDEASEVEAQEDEDPYEENEIAGSDDAHQDPEWSERKLCIDESCIGVIGSDGRCKECGRPYGS
jgi:hypothetical protein